MTNPPHDIVRTVRDELSVPGRYRLGQPQIHQHSWVQQGLEWISNRVRDVLHALFAKVKVGPHAASAFGDLLVVAVVLLVAYVAARLLMSLQMDRAARTHAVSLSNVRSAHALARMASDAAASGTYDVAIRLLFAASVTLLDLRGVVHDEASATINELRRTLRGRSGEEPFAEIARAYTAIAYAGEPSNETVWTEARASYDRLSAAISS